MRRLVRHFALLDVSWDYDSILRGWMMQPGHETEAGFQQAIVELAELHGWYVYHTHDSRRSQAGWPDLVLLRSPRIIIAEVKTAKGRLTFAQRAVLQMLDDCGIETHVWRPADWECIEWAIC